AGYFAAPGMDLIDLFIGSEGTLGVVTEARVRVIAPRPAFCLAVVPFDDRDRGLQFVDRLRRASLETRRTRAPLRIDASAIAHMDERCLQLLREDGAARANGVTVPPSAKLALLITLELAPGIQAAALYETLGQAGEAGAPDTPLLRFLNLLAEAYCS